MLNGTRKSINPCGTPYKLPDSLTNEECTVTFCDLPKG